MFCFLRLFQNFLLRSILWSVLAADTSQVEAEAIASGELQVGENGNNDQTRSTPAISAAAPSSSGQSEPARIESDDGKYP